MGFVSGWERLGPKQWTGSTLELLFSARWADLNAKEEGHPAEDLSSGERQALLLMAELRRRWRPGSLVLIDELGTRALLGRRQLR